MRILMAGAPKPKDDPEEGSALPVTPESWWDYVTVTLQPEDNRISCVKAIDGVAAGVPSF